MGEAGPQDADAQVRRGMTLLHRDGNVRTLYTVVRLKVRREGGYTATLLSFSGTGEVWSTIDTTATFPSGKVEPPFYRIKPEDVMDRELALGRVRQWWVDNVAGSADIGSDISQVDVDELLDALRL